MFPELRVCAVGWFRRPVDPHAVGNDHAFTAINRKQTESRRIPGEDLCDIFSKKNKLKIPVILMSFRSMSQGVMREHLDDLFICRRRNFAGAPWA